MADPEVQRFKILGDFYLWSYLPEKKSNSGVHFTCSNDAINSFNELVKMMIESDWSSKKDIKLSETSDRQISICGEKGKSYKSLIIKHDKKQPDEIFEILKEDDKVYLNLSTDSLLRLNESLAKIKSNEGDYSIGNHTPFWLWWNLHEEN